jgi:cyclopropane fatty-acyl-phospholipid synthase-like methyltransferase
MTDLTPNEQTVEAYNKKLSLYIQHTPPWYDASHIPLLRWIETTLTMTPSKGKILEVGSGPGRDADFISEQGYNIVCSDASQAFVDYLSNVKKREAILLDVLTDPMPAGFDMIFANAVIPHFTQSDLFNFIKKVHSALPDDGIFSFSIKQGSGEKWVTEKLNQKRYIKYWAPEEIKMILLETGFKLEYLDRDIPGDLPGHVWALFAARKV